LHDKHKPVLLDEIIKALNIQPDGFYIDGTFGRGGHSREIIKRLSSKGRLLAFDKDPDAVMSIGSDLIQDDRFEIIKGSFTMLMKCAKQYKVAGKISGVLFDFGVSSPQLSDIKRGFSFKYDAPLDMRMNPTEGESVANWLKKASESEISDVIYEFGEERASRKIAKAIITARNQTPIESTTQLVEIISKIKPSRKQDIHPATKTFQAFRIFINNELEEIRQVLPQVTDILCKGGRLAAISFHSLEDRIVKRFMRSQSKPEEHPIEIPIEEDQSSIKLKIIGKKIRPTNKEISENRRARSALLRIAERM
jgi:16S rRNA (cytosine1402-N4)-methyltransferase|tara:strand:+ start:61 stop:987 length:927 start_codon:yes stop_codon:yes gene_type:complete